MTKNNHYVSGCAICDNLKKLTPERIVWEDNHWIISGLLDVPGWLLVMTKRHVEGTWSLNDDEAAGMGRLMRDACGAVKRMTGAERVHYTAAGEVALHYHTGILPRLPGQTPVFDSMELVRRAKEIADPAAAIDMEKILTDALHRNAAGVPD